MEGVISAVITSLLGLVGVIITVASGNRKIEHKLETSQAVTDCKIDELTREVREHNNFARRMPVVEEKLKVCEHRLTDLERGG